MNKIENALKETLPQETELRTLTIQMLEESIGNKILDMSLMHQNKNTRVFKIIDIDNNVMVAKQSKTLSPEEVATEFTLLQSLGQLDINYLHIPTAVSLNSEHKTFISEFINGQSIAELVEDKDNNMFKACEMAGYILAEIHLKWGMKKKSVLDTEVLFKDLGRIPGGLINKHKILLQTAFERIKEINVPIGQSYQDYDPMNIYFNSVGDDEYKISLIDCPESVLDDILFWDIATFNVGLRKAFLKRVIVLGSNHKSSLATCENLFLKEYFSTFDGTTMENPLLRLLIKILELQRIGELMVYQENNKKYNRGKSLKGYIYNSIAMNILEKEKVRLINEIDYCDKKSTN